MSPVAGKELPVIFEEMVVFIGGPVHLAEFAPSGSDELGQSVIAAMGDANACLLTNHGVLSCGRDIKGAVKTATLVEKMAKIYWGALTLGNANTLQKKNIQNLRNYSKVWHLLPQGKKKHKELF